MAIGKKSSTGLDRRTFIKSASVAALAGAGTAVAGPASAQESW